MSMLEYAVDVHLAARGVMLLCQSRNRLVRSVIEVVDRDVQVTGLAAVPTPAPGSAGAG